MSSTYGKLMGPSSPALRIPQVLLSRASNPRWTCFRSAPRTTGTALRPRVQQRCYADIKLDLPALDRKWRDAWAKNSSSSTTDAKTGQDSTYVLPMFPYPSGSLHIGHVRVYTIADVLARFRKLQGHHVVLPMGWDSFGLPAENAAIERGINPSSWTKDNIARMKDQLQIMNGSWDWSRELSTCDPEFYKHTQKIFLLLHEKGLAYQAEAEVNYDPVDQTVLANEQVDADGCSWRSGAKVEKRVLKQWFLRISEFREALLTGLDDLSKDDAWPERVLAMQHNWLGKSVGALVKFPLLVYDHEMSSSIEVYTTRPDTLFGVQYIALAATHPSVVNLAKKDPELQAFLDTLPGLPPDSKVGYLIPHLRAINPLAYHDESPEATRQSLPVYVAPYVLGDYGEGAVMGVPGHDLRDHAFWKEHHYDQPIRVVLAASEDESTTAMINEPFIDHGIMTAHSGPFKGKSSKEAGQMLLSMLEAAELAKPVEKWRLRDWLVSRQRYWGTPIPIVHCNSCGPVPVPDEQLPVQLPEVEGHWADHKPGNPLETADEWVNTSCPKCGGAAKRDTDTMDTFVDSSWYYMRFVDPHNNAVPFSVDKAKSLLPVDLYIGGIEHAILHLLYARFVYKALMSSSLMEGSHNDSALEEPFKRLITQGMVHGKTYINPSNGRFLKPDEVDLSEPSNPRVLATGEAATITYEKMSKSKYNGVDPTAFIGKYGADATRAHMLFQAPVNDVVNWDEEKISGITRWLGRIHDMSVASKASGQQQLDTRSYFEGQSKQAASTSEEQLGQWDADSSLWRDVQKTIESVTGSYDKVYSLNTVVSDLMSLTNSLGNNETANPAVRTEALSVLLRLLAPITPAFCEECWSILHPSSRSLFQEASFPITDGTLPLLQPRSQTCAVQVNGKLRFAVDIPRPPKLTGNELKEWVVKEILKTDEGQTKLTGPLGDIKSAKKTIVVRDGKLVNFVF